jgi:hypothetical protein
MHYLFPLYRQIGDVLERLNHMKEVGDDLASGMSTAMSDDYVDCPPAEVTWTFFHLLRMRSRQRWAHKVAHKHLEERAGMGNRPGLSDWTFGFDGYGTSMVVTNRVSGERIDVSLEFGPNSVCPGDLRDSLSQVTSPTPGDNRLAELLPQGVGLRAALEHLGAVLHVHREDEDSNDWDSLWFEVDPHVADECTCYVKMFFAAWRHPSRRPALAALIGDWAFVKAAADAQGPWYEADVAAEKAEDGHRRWLNIIRVAWDLAQDEDCLQALAHAKAEDLPDYVRAALAKPNLQKAAINIVQDDPRFVPDVVNAYQRACQCGIEFGVEQKLAAQYLAKHGHRMQAQLDEN